MSIIGVWGKWGRTAQSQFPGLVVVGHQDVGMRFAEVLFARGNGPPLPIVSPAAK
jgi:hypothetical protein